jgi:hypothetical protein
MVQASQRFVSRRFVNRVCAMTPAATVIRLAQ